MKIEIKQIGKYEDRDNQAEYGEFTMLPMSSRSLVAQQQRNGRYLTGLDDKPDVRARLEEVLGKDLSNTSTYWKTEFRMLFRLPTGTMVLDLNDPDQELFYYVAQANKYLAPDRDTLKEDYSWKKSTIFYIYDEKKALESKAQLQQLIDESTSLLYNARNNREKLLYLGHAMDLFVTDSFKADTLYMVINKHKEKLKTAAQFELFRDTLKMPNEVLQGRYYVRKGLEQSVIVYDRTLVRYKFLEKAVGKAEQEVFAYFADKKNEADFAALIAEVTLKLA